MSLVLPAQPGPTLLPVVLSLGPVCHAFGLQVEML